ncbi:MAG: type I-F CRISPR-associated endoribonuclease Cas6/Csy4 [Desulfovibrio sp.]|uniref:type I-F CRISPR-associated endoribonuclease Cas6/Csy4 n=1 Tax=Desulfovibrio sp. 7SRBS1 TaxID=3378064 RepID=UPI003B3FEDA1
MDSYIDICVLPMPELADAHILNTVYSKLHLQLAALKTGGIGVSFPEVDEKKHSLGQCIRVHGSKNELEALMATRWMLRLHDYASAGSISSTPTGVQHRVVRRVQVKSSPERLRRRLMKRQSVSEEEARQRIPDTIAQKTKLPYISVQSASTGQRFKLFISHGALQPAPSTGTFSAYGLSGKASIPWF